jgi:antibiotic biosynthesis monooxygenase (ABM) superfamily enzyme
MQAPKWKTAVLIWVGIYPTITTVLWILSPYITDLALPLKTLCLTLIVVPIMAFIVLPLLTRWFNGWLKN